MNILKSIYDWTRVILFFAIWIILFFTSVSQISILYHLALYSTEQIKPIPLTDTEIDSFCLNQSCHYTHKVLFDGRYITLDWHGFHYKDTLWIFIREDEGRKWIEHKVEFLYEYLYFDIFALLYLFLYIRSVKKENAKEPKAHWKKWLQKKRSIEEIEDDHSPLPPFLGIFILGYIQIVSGLCTSFLFWQFLPRVQWIQFLVQLILVILLSYVFYYSSGKRMGIIGSSVLTIIISIFSAKNLNYIYNITHSNDSNSAQIEKVYTLNEGSLILQNMGVYSELWYTTKRNSSNKSYTYYFVVPYSQKDAPEDKTQWILLQKEWAEDPLRLELFFKKWERSRLAVQIYDDSKLYAVSVVANYHQLDVSQGIALVKPILSIEEEVVKEAIPTLIFLGVVFLIWTIFGGLRIYAGKRVS
jgi:hypothetical protein